MIGKLNLKYIQHLMIKFWIQYITFYLYNKKEIESYRYLTMKDKINKYNITCFKCDCYCLNNYNCLSQLNIFYYRSSLDLRLLRQKHNQKKK
jgi:hypothetical protein